jgi:predicted DNA binding CopG/RHH family protein
MVRGTGEKGGRYMRSRIRYTDEPMGELRVIKDFLPPPARLALKEENVKITIALKKSSVDFFKKEAQKHRTSYQKMIRQLVDWYASQYRKSA